MKRNLLIIGCLTLIFFVAGILISNVQANGKPNYEEKEKKVCICIEKGEKHKTICFYDKEQALGHLREGGYPPMSWKKCYPPKPTVTPTVAPTGTPVPTATATPTATPTSTPAPTATVTPVPTNVPQNVTNNTTNNVTNNTTATTTELPQSPPDTGKGR